MAYEIRTIEYHRNALESSAKRNAERVSNMTDLEDCALSSWGDNTMVSYHNRAIELLEKGLEITGEEIPYAIRKCLKDENGEIISTKAIFSERFNSSSWFIEDEDVQQRLGRKYIPCKRFNSSKSRIQQNLGLVEDKFMARCKPFLATNNPPIGCPISFRSVVDDEFLQAA